MHSNAEVIHPLFIQRRWLYKKGIVQLSTYLILIIAFIYLYQIYIQYNFI